jgi:hypothetical protein
MKKLRESCSDGNFIVGFKRNWWYKTLIEVDWVKIYFKEIGFTDSVVSKMNEVIKSIGYTDFWRTILRAAYNFSTDEMIL